MSSDDNSNSVVSLSLPEAPAAAPAAASTAAPAETPGQEPEKIYEICFTHTTKDRGTVTRRVGVGRGVQTVQAFIKYFLSPVPGVESGKKKNVKCRLCKGLLTLTADNQYAAIEKHMKRHGASFPSYLEHFKATGKQQQKLAGAAGVVPTDSGNDTVVELFCDYGVPFRILDDARMKKLMDGGFKSIGSETAKKHVVDRATRMSDEDMKSVASSCCTVCIDLGHTNKLHTFAITIVSRTPSNKRTFAEGCGQVTSSTSALLLPLIQTIIDALRKAHATVVAVVSDNAPNVVLASKLSSAPEVRCVAHTIQLVVRDTIMEEENIREALGILKDESSFVYQPCPTRWWSAIDCLERLSKHLRATGGPGRKIEMIEGAVARLNEIRSLGRLAERDDCSIPSAMEILYQIGKAVGTTVANKKVVNARAAVYCTPIVAVAAALHREVDWSKHHDADVDKMCDTLLAVVGAILPSAAGKKAEIRTEFVSFITAMDIDKSATDFWSQTGTMRRFPFLSTTVRALSLSCASECSTERYFSAQGNIHHPLRNKLLGNRVFAASKIRFRGKGKPKRTRDSDDEDEVDAAIWQAIDKFQDEEGNLPELSKDAANFFLKIALKAKF